MRLREGQIQVKPFRFELIMLESAFHSRVASQLTTEGLERLTTTARRDFRDFLLEMLSAECLADLEAFFASWERCEMVANARQQVLAGSRRTHQDPSEESRIREEIASLQARLDALQKRP